MAWIAGALIAAAILLGALLGPVSWLLAGSTVTEIRSPTERAAAISQVRQTLLAAVGGTAALFGIAFTARAYYLSRRGQFTDRFREAISLLASESVTSRIGAVYALEHLLVESPQEHEAIIDILTSFIRTQAPLHQADDGDDERASVRATRENYYSLPHPAVDVQAALTVLGRRPMRAELKPLDLANTDLRGAYMANGRYAQAYFSRAQLVSAYAPGANLDGAVFAYADLRGANFRGAAMRGVDCRGAQLHEATLAAARLQSARMDLAEGLTLGQVAEAEVDDRTTLRRGWARTLRPRS